MKQKLTKLQGEIKKWKITNFAISTLYGPISDHNPIKADISNKNRVKKSMLGNEIKVTHM